MGANQHCSPRCQQQRWQGQRCATASAFHRRVQGQPQAKRGDPKQCVTKVPCSSAGLSLQRHEGVSQAQSSHSSPERRKGSSKPKQHISQHLAPITSGSSLACRPAMSSEPSLKDSCFCHACLLPAEHVLPTRISYTEEELRRQQACTSLHPWKVISSMNSPRLRRGSKALVCPLSLQDELRMLFPLCTQGGHQAEKITSQPCSSLQTACFRTGDAEGSGRTSLQSTPLFILMACNTDRSTQLILSGSIT